jgi:hypothetical protein
MTQVWQGYRELEILTSPQRATNSAEAYFNELLKAHGQALLQPYVEVAMSGLMEVRADNLANTRDLNESVLHFVPISSVAYREVLLLAMAGEQAAAQTQLEQSIWAFPEGFPAALEQIRAFARKDPMHFAALLEFAPKKYEERHLAIHTK